MVVSVQHLCHCCQQCAAMHRACPHPHPSPLLHPLSKHLQHLLKKALKLSSLLSHLSSRVLRRSNQAISRWHGLLWISTVLLLNPSANPQHQLLRYWHATPVDWACPANWSRSKAVVMASAIITR